MKRSCQSLSILNWMKELVYEIKQFQAVEWRSRHSFGFQILLFSEIFMWNVIENVIRAKKWICKKDHSMTLQGDIYSDITDS